MSEAALVAVCMAAINTAGSIILSFLRYYYRAHYGLGEPPFPTRNGGSNSRANNGNT